MFVSSSAHLPSWARLLASLAGLLMLLSAVPPAAAVDGTWTAESPGSWHDPAHWSPGIPSGAGDSATFGPELPNRPGAIVLDQPATLGRLVIANSEIGEIRGAGPVQFDVAGSGGTAQMLFEAASAFMTIRPDIVLPDDSLVVAVNDADSSLVLEGSIQSPGGQVTKSGLGELELAGGSADWQGELVVDGGRVVVSHSQALGSPVGSTRVRGGELWIRQSSNEPVTVEGGTVVLADTSSSGYGGPVTLAGGVLTSRGRDVWLSGPLIAAAGNQAVIDSPSVLWIQGGITGEGDVRLAPADVVRIRGISPNHQGALRVEGGFVGLQVPSHHQGGTIVEGGTLSLEGTGSLVDTGMVTVRPGGLVSLNAPLGDDARWNSINPQRINLQGGAVEVTDDLDFAQLLAPESTGGAVVLNGIKFYTAAGSKKIDFNTLPGGDSLRLGGGALRATIIDDLVMIPHASNHTLRFGGGSSGLRLRNVLQDFGGTPTNVEQAGGGITTLEAINTYTGTTSILGGTLELSYPDGLGHTSEIILGSGKLWATQATTLSAPTTLIGGQGILGGNMTITGGVTGEGDLTLEGGSLVVVQGAPLAHSGSLTLTGSGTGSIELKSENAYTGPTLIQGSYVGVDHPLALGSADSKVVVDQGGFLFLRAAVPQDIELLDGNVQYESQDAPYEGTITLHRGSITGPGTFSGEIVIAGEDAPTSVNRSLRSGRFLGPISGAGQLVIYGDSGEVSLEAANSYTGETIFYEGTLNVNNALALGSTEKGTIVHDGTLNINVRTDEPITLEGSGRIQVNAPGQALPQIAESATGVVAIQVPGDYPETVALSGTLEVHADVTIGGAVLSHRSSKILIAPGGSLALSAGDELRLEQGMLSGNFLGPGGIRKATEGEASLSGLAHFDGEIVVERGTLEVLDSDGLGTAVGSTTVGAASEAVLSVHSGAVLNDAIHLNNASGFAFTGGLVAAEKTSGSYKPVKLNGALDLGASKAYLGGAPDADTFMELLGPVSGGGLVKMGDRMQLTIGRGSNSYSGATDVRQGDLLVGGAGRITTSSEILVRQGARFHLDNRAQNLKDRVANSIPWTLDGGTIVLENAAGTPSTETLGSVRIRRGHSHVESFGAASESDTANRIELQKLIRDPGATIEFVRGSGAQVGLRTAPPLQGGMIGGWAVVRDFSEDGGGRTFFAGVDAEGTVVPAANFVTDLAAAGPDDQVRLEGDALLEADAHIQALVGMTRGATVDLNGFTLNLASGGLIADQHQFVNGHLTSDSPTGELFFYGGGDVQADIVDSPTGAVNLVAAHTNLLKLRGNNTYSGSTTINEATVRMGSRSALPDHTDVILDGGVLEIGYANTTPKPLGRLVLRNHSELRRTAAGGGRLEFEELSLEEGRIFDTQLVGTGPMVKEGEGRVVLETPNPDYSGPVAVREGILELWDPLAAGTGPITIAGGSLAAGTNVLANDVTLAGGELAVAVVRGRQSDLDLRGSILVSDASRIRIATSGRLYVRGSIQSTVPDATLQFVSSPNSTLVLEPSVHVNPGQTLRILNNDDPVPLVFSGSEKSLSGNGTVANDVTLLDQASLEPGASSGLLRLEANVHLGPGSVYQWELSGAQGEAGDRAGWDLVEVGEALVLEGTAGSPVTIAVSGLDAEGQEGAVADLDPHRAHHWTVARAGEIVGFDPDEVVVDARQFAEENALPQVSTIRLESRDRALELVYQPTVAGDTNFDGDVDGADLTEVLLRWTGPLETGLPESNFATGDFDGDGDTDGLDLTSLLLGWTGSQAGSAARVASVPEPSGGLPLVLAWGFGHVLARRRRRAQSA